MAESSLSQGIPAAVLRRWIFRAFAAGLLTGIAAASAALLTG